MEYEEFLFCCTFSSVSRIRLLAELLELNKNEVKRVYLGGQAPLTLTQVKKNSKTHCTIVTKGKNFLARICKFKRANLNKQGMG